jgi:hypothetical protein
MEQQVLARSIIFLRIFDAVWLVTLITHGWKNNSKSAEKT